MHVSPGDSFIGGGIYRPESSALKKIREANFVTNLTRDLNKNKRCGAS